MYLIEHITLPNILTLIRLCGSPLILPILIVYCLPYDYLPLNITLALLFLGFSFTDFLDGYFARKYDSISKLGGALDHIADKFLTYSTFIALVTIAKIYFFWVIVFIGRDFFVMGLRQIALEHNFTVPVDMTGKIKTTLQILLITWLIIRPIQYEHTHDFSWHYIEISLLAITLCTTLLSAYHYYREFIQKLDKSLATQNIRN